MKDYIVENNEFIGAKEIISLSVQTTKNSADIDDIRKNMATKDDLKKVMANFFNLDTYKHFLFLDGQKIEADLAYTKIYKSAKKRVYIVDNYIGLKILELLSAVKKNVEIKVFSDNEKIYHCGASSKDAGNKITTITRIDDSTFYHVMFDELLLKPQLVIR